MSGCRRRRLIKTLLGVASLVASTSGFLLATFHSHQTTLLSCRHTDLIMPAKSNNKNDEDTAIIDLQLHTIRQSPAETLSSLSEACKALEVESFDVYGDYQSNPQQSYLRRFESEVARRFGKDDAVFCLSGGMAQSIALMIHANSHSASNGRSDVRAFVCHPTSHLILHENDSYSELLGMEAVLTSENFKENGRLGMDPMSLLDVNNILSSDGATLVTHPKQKPITCSDISTLMLELPHREIGGKLTPWDDVQGMSTLCKEKGIKFHCDGARIFEASAGYEHETLVQTAEPFDSVYISFYKGVGAVSGAMLLGNSAFVEEARVWLRRFGGNLYSVMPYAVSCWDGFRKNCVDDVFVERRRKLARVIDMLNVDKNVQSIVQFAPAIPQTSMIHGYLKASLDDCKKALSMLESRTGIRVLTRLSEINDDDASSTPFGCRFEWSMGTSNVLIDDEDFLLGWQEFSRALDGIVNESSR